MTSAGELVQDGYQITEKDENQLRIPDDEYKLQSWEDLKRIIYENRLKDLTRVPSDLRRYIQWSQRTREKYGSIQAFMLEERLGWMDLVAKDPVPYADPEDTKILINDWPYGCQPGILHLVAWTKASIATEGPLGDLASESRAVLEDFVHKTFIQRLGEDNVLWFKNWASIQSVRSLEHIHVLIRNYSDEFVESVISIPVSGVNKPIGEMVREMEQASLEQARPMRIAAN